MGNDVKNRGYSTDAWAASTWTAKTVLAEEYSYRDEAGSELYVEEKGYVLGENQKRVRMGCYDRYAAQIGEPVFKTDLSGVRRVLYRLPELIAADQNATVFITEGPKDAETLVAHGLVATTNAFGALAWAASYSEFLANRHIVICEDNDDVGIRRTAKLIGELSNVVKSLKIVRFTDLPAKSDVTDFLKNHSLDDLLKLVEQSEPVKDFIRIVNGEIAAQTDAVEAALIAADCGIYHRGGKLVRAVVDDMPAAKGYTTRAARLIEIKVDSLIDLMAKHCDFRQYDAKRQAWKKVNPPFLIAKTLLSRDGAWKFPRLSGIIGTPTMRPDGTLLMACGYDPITQLLLVAPPKLEAIPEKLTKKDAEEALALLDGLLEGFPWKDAASRSVGLSGLITPIVRGALSVAPLHAIRAPTPGSGKSFYVDVVSAIASGQKAPVISASDNPAELEKRLHALMLDARTIVNIDNVNAVLGGDALNQMIERPIVTVRRLGTSESIDIAATATLFATGNNLSLYADTVRRSLLATLDAEMERPENREFSFCPFQTVMQNRPAYIRACLIVVKAYIDADHQRCKRLGSFEDWSDKVRSALVWLGRADPVSTQDLARSEDPAGQQLAEFFETWGNLLDDCLAANNMTVGEIIKQTAAWDRVEAAKYIDAPLNAQHQFTACLLTLAGDRGVISSRKLGGFLQRNENRILSGRKLTGFKCSSTKQKRWSMVAI